MYRADFGFKVSKSCTAQSSLAIFFVQLNARHRKREARFNRGTLFPDGVPDILRIFLTGGAKYSRIYYAEVHKIADAKYPMTPGMVPMCI